MNLTEMLDTLVTLMRSYYGAVVNKFDLAMVTIKNHADRTDNPHGIDKYVLGLGRVRNYPPSTRQQAIAGRHNHSVMTPRRTGEAMDVKLDELAQVFEDATADLGG